MKGFFFRFGPLYTQFISKWTYNWMHLIASSRSLCHYISVLIQCARNPKIFLIFSFCRSIPVFRQEQIWNSHYEFCLCPKVRAEQFQRWTSTNFGGQWRWSLWHLLCSTGWMAKTRCLLDATSSKLDQDHQFFQVLLHFGPCIGLLSLFSCQSQKKSQFVYNRKENISKLKIK